MTSNEFEAVTALTRVREIHAHLEALEPVAGSLIPDAEHTQMRRTARDWEQKIVASINVWKQRSDAQASLPLEGK